MKNWNLGRLCIAVMMSLAMLSSIAAQETPVSTADGGKAKVHAQFEALFTSITDQLTNNQQMYLDNPTSYYDFLTSTVIDLWDSSSTTRALVGKTHYKKLGEQQLGSLVAAVDQTLIRYAFEGLDSYGGQVRGGAYYSQDVGQLVKKSKSYEDSLALQIEQKQDAIDAIEVDAKEDLTEYYTDVTDKEYEIANKEYLSKSLALTKEERAELEYQRRAQGMGGGQPAMQYKPKTSRGRPSLKQKSQSSSQYKNKRTRGGRDNIGGIIV